MSEQVSIKPASTADARRFGLLIGAVFIAISLLSWMRDRSDTVIGSLALAGALLVVGGLLVPKGLVPVYRAWMGLAHLLSRVTTPIFLGVVYFVVLTPTGLIRRAFGGNPLVAKEGADGFWTTSAPAKGRSMERQF